MASIVFRKGRTKPWRAQIKRKGHSTFNKSFTQKKDAQRWAAEQERNIDLTGLPLTIEEFRKITVGDLVDRYLKEITPQKASAENEKLVLAKFKRNPMCKKTLADLSSGLAAQYRDKRLKEKWKSKGVKGPGRPIKPSTVRREVNTLHHIFEVARTEWDFTNLINPFAGLTIRNKMIVDGREVNPPRRRKRRLETGELILLEKATARCRYPNQLYVPLAIWLAIETGMRLQEIFNLTWGDIDTDTRRIEIRKSKTDHVNEYEGRIIVMTVRAMFLLLAIMPKTRNPKSEKKDQKVFPMSATAFSQSWRDVVKRAGIKGLTFHDLRREAGSWFDEAGLTKAEHDLMMGHANGDMTSLYIRADLSRIQEKLDQHYKAKMIASESQRAAYALTGKAEYYSKQRQVLAQTDHTARGAGSVE